MSFKLSPSSLNLFLECPRCFWLALVEGMKRPAGIFPSLPSGMDRILKEHFDRFMERGELPPELRANDCVNGCHLFNEKEKLKIWRNNLKGIQYEDKESGVVLRGAIDNLLIDGEKLIVLDYKTRGFPLKDDTHKHYELQLDIYNFLLRKNGYKTEDYSYLLFYYPNKVNENGEVIFDTKLVRIETNPARGEKVFKDAVKVLLQKNPPKKAANCEYCKWHSKPS